MNFNSQNIYSVPADNLMFSAPVSGSPSKIQWRQASESWELQFRKHCAENNLNDSLKQVLVGFLIKL